MKKKAAHFGQPFSWKNKSIFYSDTIIRFVSTKLPALRV